MPQIDYHQPGSFCWIELATSNQAAAKDFYTSVFGWSFEDSPMGPGAYYTMFQLEGRNVGAAYTQHGAEVEMRVPPHWNLYIAVQSADEIAKRASELGGTVLAAPFDVFTSGRMAVIQDPTGATFCIWQANEHKGTGVQNQHGTFCWADLNTPDQHAAQKFYGDLFGWTFTPDPSGYLHIKSGEVHIGGIPPDHQRNKEVPPHWMIYIQTDDCDASTEIARNVGASILFGPITLEKTGRFTILMDPQQAVFALFQSLR